MMMIGSVKEGFRAFLASDHRTISVISSQSGGKFKNSPGIAGTVTFLWDVVLETGCCLLLFRGGELG